jgi:CheY-like chemotaxis protein
MPRMNGFEFLEHYNTHDSQYKAKKVVVMLTSSVADKDKDKAHELGAGLETKPLTKEGFVKLVEKFAG